MSLWFKTKDLEVCSWVSGWAEVKMFKGEHEDPTSWQRLKTTPVAPSIIVAQVSDFGGGLQLNMSGHFESLLFSIFRKKRFIIIQ